MMCRCLALLLLLHAAAASGSDCWTQPDIEQVCAELADQCADLFCPSCGLAGQCDTTCGFCSTAPPVTTTTTIVGTTCANQADDSFCECDGCKDLCPVIYCPSCGAHAGYCDLSCGYCTASTSASTNTFSPQPSSTGDPTATHTSTTPSPTSTTPSPTTSAMRTATPTSTGSLVTQGSTSTRVTTTVARTTSSTTEAAAGDAVAGTGGGTAAATTTTLLVTTSSTPAGPAAAAAEEAPEQAEASELEDDDPPSGAGLQIGVVCLVLAACLVLGVLLCLKRRRQGRQSQDAEGDARSLSAAKASPDDIALSFVEEGPAGATILTHTVAVDEGSIKLTCPAVQVAGSRGAVGLALASSPVEARDLEVAETPEKRGMLYGEPAPQEMGKKLSFAFCTREDYLDEGDEYLEAEEDNKRDF